LGNAFSYGQQYQVTGKISVTEYHFGQLTREHSSTFEAKVVSNSWEIATVPSEGTGDFQKISFDGTNMYVLHDLERSVADLRASGKPVANNLANGFVLQKEVPHDIFSEGAGQVWLAYASADFFSKHQHSEPLETPYYQGVPRITTLVQTRKRPALWQLSEYPLKLPNQVTYFFATNSFIEAIYTATKFVTLDGDSGGLKLG
jgi:hypothetical protein